MNECLWFLSHLCFGSDPAAAWRESCQHGDWTQLLVQKGQVWSTRVLTLQPNHGIMANHMLTLRLCCWIMIINHWKSRVGNFVVTSGTIDCRYDKLRCQQWRQTCIRAGLLWRKAKYICNFYYFWHQYGAGSLPVSHTHSVLIPIAFVSSASEQPLYWPGTHEIIHLHQDVSRPWVPHDIHYDHGVHCFQQLKMLW